MEYLLLRMLLLCCPEHSSSFLFSSAQDGIQEMRSMWCTETKILSHLISTPLYKQQHNTDGPSQVVICLSSVFICTSSQAITGAKTEVYLLCPPILRDLQLILTERGKKKLKVSLQSKKFGYEIQYVLLNKVELKQSDQRQQNTTFQILTRVNACVITKDTYNRSEKGCYFKSW